MSNRLLLIGIDTYPNQSKLNCCVKDVTDFKNVLIEKYDFDEANIYQLLDERATNRNIQDAFKGLIKTAKPEDNLIIYFSGHGGYDEHIDCGYWIPYDGNADYTTWIANDIIVKSLGRILCKHIFLISDSCFSNSLLLTNKTKVNSDYAKYGSRWALTSAFKIAVDSEDGSNTYFAESIIHFLEAQESDFKISELIDDVKRAFSSNIMQAPQGSPIQVEGHEGGELVLYVKQSLDNRSLRGYSDFHKTLQLYKRNSEFTEIKTYEDKSLKVGFQLFQEYDTVLKKATYYLYLYEGIIQVQTLKYLKEHHQNIFLQKNLVIFLPKEKDQQKLEARKNNISNKFRPVNLFYIDDFIRDLCTPKILMDDDSKFLIISNFIPPILNGKINSDNINSFIDHWFEKENEPILVVKGAGGIGKTTFAQYISDYAIKSTPKTTVLFIDSVQIKDNLLKNISDKQIYLYDFYVALCNITESMHEKLSEELFRINLDAGNILLIIDGLDEVISKIPNFDVSLFLTSIDETTRQLGGAKVIITCRTHFWDINEFRENKYTEIELEPFNRDQTSRFFDKSFDTPAKIKKAVKLAEEFKYPGADDDNIFHPYVLDIIRSIVNSEKQTIESDLSNFTSKLLNNDVKNDYIIFRVCDREQIRIGQINVDDQVEFFIHFAITKRGMVRVENFRSELEEALDKHIDNTNVESFKAHPFLKQVDRSILFKYDFLADLFKSIYIARYFNYESKVTTISLEFVDLLIENCWFGSAINNDIVNRVSHWTENDILFASDVIMQISDNSGLKPEKKKKAIANIFNLCLSINHKFFSKDIFANTTLLKQLFAKKSNHIENLYIIDINSEQNVRFDFSGLTLSHCHINNYSSFWDCNFDSQTKFINCQLFNLKAQKFHNKINKENIIDCVFDKEVENTLKNFEETQLSKVELARVFVNDFFHLFFSNGKLGRQWEDKVIKPRYGGISKNRFPYKNAIKIFKNQGIISVNVELGRNKFAIEEKFKEDVLRFIKDGTVSNVITRLVNDLSS